MKNSYLGLGLTFSFIAMLALLGFFVGTSPTIASAHAANANVVMALRNYGDLSMFYEAMVNSGVINELDENRHYTIFAPVNTAFMEIPPQTYPCFYARECRPQIAALVRDHIVAGRHDIADLVTYGSGVQSDGSRRIHVDQPYVGDYTADGRKILSKTEIDGNIVYRVDGFLASRQQLAQFQTGAYIPASGEVTTKRTITTETYLAPMAEPAQHGISSSAYGPAGDDEVETTTTVIQRNVPEPQ